MAITRGVDGTREVCGARVDCALVNVDGRRTLLTGATGGIGHAVARRLHAAAAELVISGRRADVLAPLAAELGASTIAADLADPADVERLIEEAGAVDVLVANAALPGSGRLETFSEQEIDRALAVNLRAPIMLARALAPAMAQRGSGQIVFMNSSSGKAATAYTSIYVATKFGLRGFALALRAELRGTGVGVSSVFPSFVSDAGMFADTQIELPRFVRTRSPEQVADAVLRAIEHDRAEIDVAPASLRAGAVLSGLAPDLAARVSRAMGAEDLGAEFEAAQREKR
jgi:short-subunit dehydrogenase